MPELEIISALPLELDRVVVSTFLYPKPSDIHQRQACCAKLVPTQINLFADIIAHGPRGPYCAAPPVPPRNDLEEDQLAGLLRDDGYGLVAEATRFLLMAALGAPEHLSLKNGYLAASRIMTRVGKRGTTPRSVRHAWKERGPAGPLALALKIVSAGSRDGQGRLRQVADMATWIAEKIEGVRNRHLKEPVVEHDYFWRMPAKFRREVEVAVGDVRGVAEAMLAGDHERLWRTLEGLPLPKL
jgi:hypothetical protein